MIIHELRKTASKNKKYKHIYHLVIKGEIVSTRRSNIDYAGIWFSKDNKPHWFIAPSLSTVIAKMPLQDATAMALTFDELKRFKGF